MDILRRFLKTNSVFQHIKALTLSATLIATACAPSGSGGSSASADYEPQYSENPITCGASTSSTSEGHNEVEASRLSLPSITLDDNFDSYIVEFENQSRTSLKPSGNPVREYQVAGVYLTRINNTTYSFKMKGNRSEKEQIVNRLARDRAIRFVEPDYPIQNFQNIETTYDGYDDLDLIHEAATKSQWAHENVESNGAWKTTLGSSELVVAVVDSGIDYTHTDLKNNIWINTKEVINGKDDDGNGYIDDVYGWNFVSNNKDPRTTSKSNHGTHVAGIIGATGSASSGVYGESRKVKLMALRFIGETGTGATSAAVRAIDYAVNKRVFAINNSWGSNYKSQALENAIKRAENAGILFIVAAGNGENGTGYDITQKAYYPAAFTNTNIIRVAASTPNNTLTSFSNYGVKLVDVAAPGQSIISTVTGNKYMKMSGTSMATPLVSGLAVLIKAANKSLNYAQIKSIISASVDTIPGLKNKIRSGGRVNAHKAVQMASQISPNLACP